jgi:hypothetical protein
MYSFVTRTRSIKLDGDEKILTAEYLATPTDEKDPAICTAPADYS